MAFNISIAGLCRGTSRTAVKTPLPALLRCWVCRCDISAGRSPAPGLPEPRTGAAPLVQDRMWHGSFLPCSTTTRVFLAALAQAVPGHHSGRSG